MRIADLQKGLRLRNLLAGSDVVLVAIEAHGDGIANVVYRSDDGTIADRLVTDNDLDDVIEVTGSRWTFDADGAAFRLASEARRIELAHVFDPFAAVEASTIRPLPHQIEAVYDRLLPQQPLHFLLADDAYVRDPFLLRVAYLLAQGVIAVIDINPDIARLYHLCDFHALVYVFL